MNIIFAKLKQYYAIVTCISIICLFVIFLMIIYRDAYSLRSMIPNLEPFPDTMFYSNPAWNFVHGRGFVMQAFDYETKIITPPLYSIYLIPFFALFNDVRSYYFANVLLSVISFAVFIVISKHIFKGRVGTLIMTSLGFFYATNFFLDTIPSLLMAENITLTFSLMAIYISLQKVTVRKSIIAVVIAGLLLLIKFSNLPVAVALIIVSGYKVFFQNKDKHIKITFIASIIVVGLVFLSYIIGTKILVGHKNLSHGSGFGMQYFVINTSRYLSTLFGTPGSFLWYNARFFSSLLGILALIGMIIGVGVKKYRETSLILLIYAVGTIGFMSCFYAVDVRYILVLLPVLFFYIGILFEFTILYTNVFVGIIGFICVISAFLLIPQFGYIQNEKMVLSLRKQIGLNLRFTEDPWHYKALQFFNTSIPKNQKHDVYLGTFLPPYYVSYFSNGNYKYLPITTAQEFFHDKVHSPKEYTSSLAEYYTVFLKKGDEIYISDYYKSNNFAAWHAAYEELVNHFSVKLVQNGCLNTCNLYKLDLKESNVR